MIPASVLNTPAPSGITDAGYNAGMTVLCREADMSHR
jgi:hypothetical protein